MDIEIFDIFKWDKNFIESSSNLNILNTKEDFIILKKGIDKILSGDVLDTADDLNIKSYEKMSYYIFEDIIGSCKYIIILDKGEVQVLKIKQLVLYWGLINITTFGFLKYDKSSGMYIKSGRYFLMFKDMLKFHILPIVERALEDMGE